MASPTRKSRKKPVKSGKISTFDPLPEKSLLELVENLRELHRWQGIILNTLFDQAQRLKNEKQVK